MRNPLLDRINNERFSIRLMRIAEKNNIKTVGSMIKFTTNHPNANPYGHIMTVTVK